MTQKNIEEVKADMARLAKRIEEWENKPEPRRSWSSPLESGAIKRASMDLTRSLARLRRGEKP